MSVIEIQNLNITYKEKTLLNNINLSIKSGKITALIGKSGSGKTLTATALNGFLASNLSLKSELFLNGEKISSLPKGFFANIMQNPASAFDPLHTMGHTAKESLSALNLKFDKNEVLEAFKDVGLEKRVYDLYPFEMSGGMLQRAMIAIALLQKSPFLIADEPTTDLDLIVQGKILDILKEICTNKNVGILLITHDFGVVAKIADDVFVIDDGKIIEKGGIREIFNFPNHEITKALINAHLSLYGMNKDEK